MDCRPTILFITAFLFPLLPATMSGCGELSALITDATEEEIDPNFNFDSDGRKVAGGCNLSSVKECYQYSNEGGYGTYGTDHFESNCTDYAPVGEWIPRGCSTSSAYGYCEKKYAKDSWVRHYYYTGHTMTYGETVGLCGLDQETWVDP